MVVQRRSPAKPPAQPGRPLRMPVRLPVAAVWWEGDSISIVDQRRLPEQLVEWRLRSVDEVEEAIRTLAVRGAPAIGITGAYGLVVGLDESGAATAAEARATLDRLAHRVGRVRPTAINLRRALAEAADAGRRASGGPAEIRAAVLDAALAMHAEDQAACAAIGRHGRDLLGERRAILTHCNTGRLATGGDGTALGVVYALQAAGRSPQVIATEARPILQGARLTAWELTRSGVDVRLIADAAAGFAMQRGMVDAVIVGCDRVAANGDTANKVGTYSLAVLARRHAIPFYVAGPLTSFDSATARGDQIVVEERSADEVRRFHGRQAAPVDVDIWNPAFDVTPGELIDAFITEVGVLRPPFERSIRDAVQRAARDPDLPLLSARDGEAQA